jgi:uncharacterized membrane protein
MSRLARLLFILLLIAATILIGATTGQLPAQIASHFGAGGVPTGWMSRNDYRLVMLALAVVLPVVVVLGSTLLPRLSDSRINIPNRDHWLAPARRDATFQYLASHAYWLGSLLVAFIAAVHLLLLDANATQPPRLSSPLLVTLLVLFMVALAAWIATMAMHFRHGR